MDFRNKSYNQHGTIDCEINHPKLGWIPFTADINDPDELGAALAQAIIDDCSAPPASDFLPADPEQIARR